MKPQKSGNEFLAYLCVVLLGMIASWWYFYGTPLIWGLDYFTHLANAHFIKTGIEQGNPLPAYITTYGYCFGGFNPTVIASRS